MNAQTEKPVTEKESINRSAIVLDDRLVRMIGIPFFGIVIPSATGLIHLSDFSFSSIIHYFYFIIVALVIWEGNRFLLYRYYPVIFRSQSLFQKYVVMTALNIFYTGPVSLLLLYGWKWTAGPAWVSDQAITNSIILIVVCVIFVTNVYEKALFVKESENLKIIREQLERGKIQAELEALKNQIDPHFMFNMLNSISYLVDHAPGKARKFVENLAEVYRYILKSKDKNLVILKDEIDFMNAYTSLIELRFGTAFQLKADYKGADVSKYLIPPVSLMTAVENAVKHNRISGNNPLVLYLEFGYDSIWFSNRINEKKGVKNFTKTGLKNLDERFLKLAGKNISVRREKNIFTLELPLLKLTV